MLINLGQLNRIVGMKIISILGSTGSIGQSTLSVVRRYPEKFSVYGLSANNNAKILIDQAREFKPKVICVNSNETYRVLKKEFGGKIELYLGEENISAAFSQDVVGLVVLAISGVAALKPLIEAIKQKKTVVMANKEAIVAAGKLVMDLAKREKAHILPVDSEHSAIWQCLQNGKKKEVSKIYLTASGGMFRNYSTKELEQVTPEQAINHPRWKMGKKITVDCGTLMNKGLEVIEAMYLFGLSFDQIEILVHPESIIHSMVEYRDGVTIAQLGVPSMQIPIQYALTYPERVPIRLNSLDFGKLGSLTFEKPRLERFPCLKLALEAAQLGQSMPCVLNAANEVAVESFLDGGIRFTDIYRVVDMVLSSHPPKPLLEINSVFECSTLAKEEAKKMVAKLVARKIVI